MPAEDALASASMSGDRAVPLLALRRIDLLPSGAVPLAPWCYLGCEASYPGWDRQSFPDVSQTPDEQLQCAFTARQMARDMVGPLAVELNALHGCDYDTRFWNTLMMPWLTAMSQAVKTRWIEIEKFLANHRDQPFRVPVWSGPVDWQFRSLSDFWQRGLLAEPFNYWLTSRLALMMAPPEWQFEPADEHLPDLPTEHIEALPTPVKRLARGVLGRFRFDNVLGVRPVEILLFSIYLSLLPSGPEGNAADERTVPEGSPVEKEQRDLFSEIVRATLPDTYTKRFSNLEKDARAKPYGTGKRSVKGGVLMFNEREIFEAAFSEAAGEKVVSVQHGGVYGISLSLPDAGETEYRHDTLVTWGWSGHSGHPVNAVPLPSPFLSRFRDRHCERTDDIVLVGTQLRAFGGRLDSTPRGRQVLDYRRDKIAFIEALAPVARGRFAYRPGSPDVTSFEDLAFIERAVGAVPVIRDKFHDTVLGCRLIVIDHLGTTPAISMAANTPTVLYMRDAFWPISPDAEAYFSTLAEVGIFHNDPIAAAQHINGVAEDISSWWLRDDVQSARERWLEQFARTRKRWRAEWLSAMARM